MELKKRFPIVIIGIAILLVMWVIVGFEGNELPYVTIQELEEMNSLKPGKRFRMGGNVLEGSILRDSQDQLALSFSLQQGEESIPVNYHKIVPDMFMDGAEVIVEGYYGNGTFQADNLMTKCASKYEGDLSDSASVH